jgi:serine protease Do
MSSKRILYAFILMLVVAIAALGGAVAGGVAVFSAVEGQTTTQSESIFQPSPTAAPIAAGESPAQIVITDIDTPITSAVEKVGPSVVTVVGIVPGQMTFFGRTTDYPVSGSGVIISNDGYILTNNHVVEGTQDVSVTLADGEELPAEIIGTDEFSDLAVLKTDGTIPAIASLGNSDSLKPGETVIAIGSPLGDFKNTVTVGVVSGTERSIQVNENYSMEGLIQTDAAINQGNSGGPLVNLAGEVIGINTLIVRGGDYGSAIAEGLGFAIPINTAKAVAQQLIEKGYFSYPYLGIRWQWITPSIAARYGLPVDSGAYVSTIDPGSPGDVAGLEPGDILVQIGEQQLDESHPFINVLYAHVPGETTTLSIVRGQESLTLSVTFEEYPTP